MVLSDLTPVSEPNWTRLSDYEVTSCTLLDTNGEFICASYDAAVKYAAAFGAELTSAAEEDAIWLAARYRLLPMPRADIRFPPAEQSKALWDELAKVYIEPGLIAGTGKVWTRDKASRPGHVCNYGWHVPLSACEPVYRKWVRSDGTTIPTDAPFTHGLPARVLQPLSGAHNADHVDYSQQVRLRRVVK